MTILSAGDVDMPAAFIAFSPLYQPAKQQNIDSLAAGDMMLSFQRGEGYSCRIMARYPEPPSGMTSARYFYRRDDD